ncbi:lantibiotic dehydratase [Pontibacter mangrovi]|nr:lantibiotic dehydratase [Pontibacter mangrovi]
MYKLYPGLLLRTPAFPHTAYSTTDLHALIRDPSFQAALQLASPSLFKTLETSAFDYEAIGPKAKASLQRYLNRMCFRPTPFGLFSGFSLALWGAVEEPPLQLREQASQVHLALTFGNTLHLARQLLAEELAGYQRYRPNHSLYKVHGGYRYIRFEEDRQRKRREFFLTDLQTDPLLEAVLTYCREGCLRQDIVAYIRTQAAVEAEESRDYVEQLVARQVLVSDLEANITGEDYLPGLLELCGAQGVSTSRTRGLQQLLAGLKAEKKPGADLLDKLRLASCMQELGSQGVYANLEKGMHQKKLRSFYQEALLAALTCLQRLVPQPDSAGLQKFARDFQKKFEGRAVPLLRALDPELGVGYGKLAIPPRGAKLLEGMVWDRVEAGEQMAAWSPVHALLLEKWHAAGPFPAAVHLTEQEVARLPEVDINKALPPSIAVLFRVVGEEVFMEQAGGASATALLGRFTPHHPEVLAMARAIAQAEESANPGVVFAEIAHVCESHTANIDRRAAVRSYEIPVLVQSALPAEQQIHLSELWVQVKNGTIVLWSERLQQVVVPRLSSAFNFVRDDLAVFRFLCELQYQGLQSNLCLDLRHFFPRLPYYPRVVYQGAVLQLASWHLGQEQLKKLAQGKGAVQQACLRQLAREMRWPRWIALTRHDQQVVFDLEREDDCRLLLESLRGKEAVELREFPFTAQQAAMVRDSAQQPYVHEFLGAVLNGQAVYSPQPFPSLCTAQTPLKERLLSPGEGWLYVKLYCHPSAANALLAQTLQPWLTRLEQEGQLTQWFFVRYRDPDYHLRLRLCLPTESGAGHLLECVSERLAGAVRRGTIRDWQVAVYERELERYHPALIEAVEEVFCASSALLAAFLRHSPCTEEDEGYYAPGFSGLDAIGSAFGLDVAGKEALVGELYASFYREFGGTKRLEVQLAQKFREFSRLFAVGTTAGQPDKLRRRFEEALAQVAQRAAFLSPAREKQLIADLMHMHLNRLFTDRPREQELVLYYCLWKHYRAVRARQKQAGKCPQPGRAR